MIVACPGCDRRYRIDPEALGPAGRKLRCRGCGNVFAPSTAAKPAAPGAPTAAPPRTPGPTASGRPLALVADEAREFRDLVCRTLQSVGCRVETTDDGEAAFRFAVAQRPDVMVLNVYLRRLLGVAVCEGVKGSPDLRATRVALVGSVFKSERFVRSPGHIYGADDYFEDIIAESDLRARLRRLLGGRAAAAPTVPGHAIGAAPAGEAGSRDLLEPRSEIRRLARIMLSDLKIYYPQEFASAIAGRAVFETFREELTKGKDLIARRFPDLPDRIEVLAAALREGIEEERGAGRPDAAGPPA